MNEKVVRHPQYIKIKRQDTTYFMMCDEYENVEAIKSRVASLAERPPETIRLYLGKKVCNEDDYTHSLAFGRQFYLSRPENSKQRDDPSFV